MGGGASDDVTVKVTSKVTVKDRMLESACLDAKHRLTAGLIHAIVPSLSTLHQISLTCADEEERGAFLSSSVSTECVRVFVGLHEAC